MTIGDLKRLLATVPDELPVVMEYDGSWIQDVAVYRVRHVDTFDRGGVWVHDVFPEAVLVACETDEPSAYYASDVERVR